MNLFSILEQNRLDIQEALDAEKTQLERNRLGQFATPTKMAQELVSYGIYLLPENSPIRFLDPAIGTGAFFSALLETAFFRKIDKANGIEIDAHYALPAQKLWTNTLLEIDVEDFTKKEAPSLDKDKFNLLICNPPYVRHHHIPSEDKIRLQLKIIDGFGISLSGLTGLYCYYLILSHYWMSENGIGAWLIPSEFMDVNYGVGLKKYLLNHVTLLRIHRYDPNEVQFDDALVSSTVIWFKKQPPSPIHNIEFTFGGSIDKPRIRKFIPAQKIHVEDKWSNFPVSIKNNKTKEVMLSDFFTIKRGLATGDNKFFILTEEKIKSLDLPMELFRPILPSPRYLKEDEIIGDVNRNPIIPSPNFLLNVRLSEDEIKIKYPSLWSYLMDGKNEVSKRYLCQHRSPWYSQEERTPAPILFTYLGRCGNDNNDRIPFRFILNNSVATATNVYLLLYPKDFIQEKINQDPHLLREIWNNLKKIQIKVLLQEGRFYGGGLYKLEPKELAKVRADGLLHLMPDMKSILEVKQLQLAGI